MSDAILCQGCGIEAATKYVEFHQNIGMLVMRRSQKIRGNLCKNCINKHFWKMTGTTLAVGWLGTISLIVAPIFVINNIVRYLGALSLTAPPPGAQPPVVDNTTIAKMYPHLQTLYARVNAGEKINPVCRDIAGQCGATPGQVLKYVMQMTRKPAADRSIGGFEVLPLPPTGSGGAADGAIPLA